MTTWHRIAGMGFREAATPEALLDALTRAGGPDGVTALACLDRKADAPALRALAARLCLPVLPVSAAQLAAQHTLTRSPAIIARFGTGSVAEAAALACAGAQATLKGPRARSQDGTATAAIAEGGLS